MTSGDRSSGIKSFSVGLGSSPASARRALRPAPPYRLLIAGDFGFVEEGELHRFAGDIEEFIQETGPIIDVMVDNLLGSLPVQVSETVRLAAIADLRPATLLRQFRHYRTAMEALENGDDPGKAGQRYDRLAIASGQQGMIVPQTGAEAGPIGDGDGLDRLFGLVETPSSKAIGFDSSPANLISTFIADNIAPKASTGQAARRKISDDGAALLDAQALAFLSDGRLRQVLENWHGLRMLLDAAGKDRGIQVALLQVAVGTDAQTLHEHLAGSDGAMHEELFDLLVFANRCWATSADVEILKALAETADSFDIVAFVTLDPDFARVPAEQFAAMDAPHQVLAGPGFEAFNALRAQASARRLGVFWNDVLIAEGSPVNPELYIPAAWASTAMALTSVRHSGWPGFGSPAGRGLSGFPVAVRTLRGREIAVATRALATEESAAGLASVGIAALNGRIDRDSVHLARAPLFSGTRTDTPQTPDLNDQLVLARVSQLLQSVVPEILSGEGSAAEKADMLERRFAELAEAIAQSPRFAVKATNDESGNPALDISVDLPEGIAVRNRFEFQIPC